MSSPSSAAAASSLQLDPSQHTSRVGGSRHIGLPTAVAGRRAATGSTTQTITPIESASSRSGSASPDPLVLRLRGAHDAEGSSTRTRRPRIHWAEDVVDNEGLGRKSSKVCCIYHKTREFGESSSEDEDDSSSDSDSDAGGSDSPDDGGARMSGSQRGRGPGHGPGHGHQHGDDCAHGKGKGKGKAARKPSPNAYERMPKYHTKRQDDARV